MALSVPNYPNPFNPSHPFNAYVYASGVYFDASNNTGRLVMNVHSSETNWVNPPVDQIGISLGEVLVPANPSAEPPTEAITFPTFEGLMADEEFASAYNALGAILYAAALPHSKLAGATTYVAPEA